METKKLLLVIILTAIILRLINITTSYHGHHNWKEAESGLIARHYYENQNYNLLNPHFDDSDEEPNYALQLSPWLAALLYNFFGVQEWVGRIISVTFSVATIPLIYLLGKEWFGERTGLLASLLMAVMPAQAFFGRNFQPESISLFFATLSIYFTNKKGRKNALLSALSLMIGALTKSVVLTTLLPIAVILYYKKKKKLSKTFLPLLVVAVISITPAVSYMAWKYETATKYHPEWSEYLTMSSFYWEHVKRAAAEIYGPSIAILLLASLFFLIKEKKDMILLSWFLAYLSIIFITGRGAYANSYYLFPTCAPASIIVAKSLKRFTTSKKKSVLILGTIIITTLPVTLYLLNLSYPWLSQSGKMVNSLLEEDEMWIYSFIVGGGNFQTPTVPYYVNREGVGWQYKDEGQLVEYIDNTDIKVVLLVQDYHLISQKSFLRLKNNFEMFTKTPEYVIFKRV